MCTKMLLYHRRENQKKKKKGPQQHTAIMCHVSSVVYHSSSSSFFAMAFFLASSASAKLPARFGVGVLLLLLSDPLAPFRLMPESRGWSAAGFLPAAGRLTGGCGGVGLPRFPFAAGGGGGARGATTGGGGAACFSTYAEGTQACWSPFLANHHPVPKYISNLSSRSIHLRNIYVESSPLFSSWTISMRSPALIESSFSFCPAKS